MEKIKNMSKKEMLSFATRRRRHFEALLYVEDLGAKDAKTPELTFSTEKHSSARSDLITVGLGGLKAKNEEELFAQICFYIGLERQHLKSTVKRDWEAAEQMALKTFCNKASMDIFGSRRRLLKESDIQAFFKECPAMGYYLSEHTIRELINFITGTLEEARVERIRTEKNPGFLPYRQAARGAILRNRPLFPEGVTPISYEDLNPAEHLKALQQQISFLATCEKFQMGFLRQYIATEFYDEVREYIPPIVKAISAATCKECMKYAQEILRKMYPRIMEASKYTGGLEQMMKELLEAQANMPSESQFNANPWDEEEGSGEKPEKLFDDSDLEVTLKDEAYDKLMQQDAGNNQEEDGMRIKREHDYDENPFTQPPKENQNQGNLDSDEKEDGSKTGQDQETGSSDGNDSSSSEEGEEDSTAHKGSNTGNSGKHSSADDEDDESTENGSVSSGNDFEESEEDNSSGGFGEEPDEDADEDDAVGSSSTDDDSDLDEDESSEAEEEADVDSRSSDSDNGERPKADSAIQDSGAGKSSMTAEEERAAIEDAMEKAVSEILPDLNLSEKEEMYEDEFRRTMEQFRQEQKPALPDLSSLNGHYKEAVSFQEFQRRYIPDIPLPYGLEKKGASLRRKMEEILRNKEEPNRRGVRSGSIDGTRLYKLISSETTIFKKRGEKTKPDVCGYLLMDNSGSMGNGPRSTRHYACNALSVIEEGFKEFMPLKIAAFDSNGSDTCTHEIIKDFDENAVCNFSHNFLKQGRSGRGNKDGYSIRVAAEELLKRPEKEKVLIVASDGLPSCYGYDESGVEDVENAVAEARKNGIKVIGMYMYSHADESTFQKYHQMYAPDYLMVTVDEIEKELSRILKRLFI